MRLDADRDGVCVFGTDLDGDGQCISDEERANGFDCDDQNPFVHSLAFESCGLAVDNNCDGILPYQDPVCAAVVDKDADGFCSIGRDLNADRDCLDEGEWLAQYDCDDTTAAAHVGAGENCHDAEDGDCDGLDDADDPDCLNNADLDDDGYCATGVDADDNGICEDGELSTSTFDCDESTSAANTAALEICGDGFDNNCDGLADFDAPECADLRDDDGDGHCVQGIDDNGNGHCLDAGEMRSSGDCDDMDAARFPNAPERCRESRDYDCDGLNGAADPSCAAYVDGDGDGYCASGKDVGGDGDCLALGDEPSLGIDCNESAGSINPDQVENCTDGIDNDCNGVSDARDPACTVTHFDFDGDGWCEVGQDLSDPPDNDCSDPGEQAGPSDAAPRDPTISPGRGEHCFDGKDNDQDGDFDSADLDCVRNEDADGDGYCPIGQDENGDGNCNESSAQVSDCEPNDANINPGSTENCRNRQDDDCDGLIDISDEECVVFLDGDGDGFCPTRRGPQRRPRLFRPGGGRGKRRLR